MASEIVDPEGSLFQSRLSFPGPRLRYLSGRSVLFDKDVHQAGVSFAQLGAWFGLVPGLGLGSALYPARGLARPCTQLGA